MNEGRSMHSNDPFLQIDAGSWSGPFSPELQDQATAALEAGRVIVLPHLPFQVEAEERTLLAPATSGGERKNVSFDPKTGKVGNVALEPAEADRVVALLDRFGREATRLVSELLPNYASALERARTSFRPTEIKHRSYSPRHDDRLLHVDAFPTRPLHGRRILRVFSNVAPDASVRTWRVGEPFHDFARKFLPRVRGPLPGTAALLATLGLTKGRRSPYDHIMLSLHDAGKLDSDYQKTAPSFGLDFASGSTWLCFTDQVLHAAMAGHCALEQTFHVPVEIMADPGRSPLRVLEQLTGRSLA
jgi:hypothetical protein